MLWRRLRRLRRLGVTPLADGLVALPADARTREQLEWLAGDVVEAGGTARMWLARPTTAAQEHELAAGMAAAQAEEYRPAVEQCRSADPRRGAHRPGGCAWLIRRFLDQDPECVFVADPAEVPTDATPFDMRGVELGHHGGDCSFETILRRYSLTDPLLWRIAEIVHEADLDDERFDAPEVPGLDVVLQGLAMAGSDERTLAIPLPIFERLYEYHRRRLLLGREPA
jgi:hypothetical protein